MPRREKGTGMEPRLRADGRWETRYTGADGRRVPIYVRDHCPRPHPVKPTGGLRPCADYRTCTRLRDDAIKASQAGVVPSLRPLADYLERHIARSSRNWSAATVERYARLVKNHVRGTDAGAIPIARLAPDDLDDLYADRLAAGMQPKGLELLHTLIHGALAVAAQRGHVIRNAADHVKRPRVIHRPRPTYAADQVRQLLVAAEGSRIEGLVAIAATIGLRHGELLGLRWRDIDLDGARLVLMDPEKDGTPRTILLSARVVRTLRVCRARQAAEILASGGAYEEDGLVFANPFGEPLERRRVRDELHRITKRAGLPAMTPHGLRHTAATLLMEQGIPVKVVQEILGHATAQQTLETYSHVTPTLQAEAVRAMDRAVGE